MEILFKYKNTNASHRKILENFLSKPNLLKDTKTQEIIETMNSISNYWISDKCGVRDLIKKYEIGFITLWTKKSNLEKLMKLNFNNFTSLDKPIREKNFGSMIYGRPLGLAVHWVAGNIPLLAIISLFQTLLTKNRVKTLEYEQKKKVIELIEKIEEDNDVQNVYHTLDTNST